MDKYNPYEWENVINTLVEFAKRGEYHIPLLFMLVLVYIMAMAILSLIHKVSAVVIIVIEAKKKTREYRQETSSTDKELPEDDKDK